MYAENKSGLPQGFKLFPISDLTIEKTVAEFNANPEDTLHEDLEIARSVFPVLRKIIYTGSLPTNEMDVSQAYLIGFSRMFRFLRNQAGLEGFELPNIPDEMVESLFGNLEEDKVLITTNKNHIPFFERTMRDIQKNNLKLFDTIKSLFWDSKYRENLLSGAITVYYLFKGTVENNSLEEQVE